MSADRFGFELPLLLAAAFRTLIDGLHDQLAARGHPDARPIHAFALQAIGPDGATVSELGRRLGVSKQAAAKTAPPAEPTPAALPSAAAVASASDTPSPKSGAVRSKPRPQPVSGPPKPRADSSDETLFSGRK